MNLFELPDGIKAMIYNKLDHISSGNLVLSCKTMLYFYFMYYKVNHEKMINEKLAIYKNSKS